MPRITHDQSEAKPTELQEGVRRINEALRIYRNSLPTVDEAAEALRVFSQTNDATSKKEGN